jgi:hypothetical protein
MSDIDVFEPQTSRPANVVNNLKLIAFVGLYPSGSNIDIRRLYAYNYTHCKQWHSYDFNQEYVNMILAKVSTLLHCIYTCS